MVVFDGSCIYLLGWDRRTFLDVTVPCCFLLKLLQPILGASVITVSMCYCRSEYERLKILFDILLSVNLDLTFGKLSFSEPCIAFMGWFQITYQILSQQMRFLIALYLIESEKVSLMILFFSIIFFPHSSANKFPVISEVTR